MTGLVVIIFAGTIGGMMRGLVGYVKYRRSYKETKFMLDLFLLSVGVSAGAGLLAAWISYDLNITFLDLPTITPALGVVIGYAGGDFVENLFKIIAGRTSLLDLPRPR